MSSPRVCILVLNWNGADDTIDCLNSLQALTYPAAQVVVIDNGSDDDSISKIQTAHPDVKMIQLPRNLLFGGGNNAGLAWAQDQQFDFVIFLNNDTLVEPDFVEPLLSAFEQDSNIGMVAPLICYADQPQLIWYAGGRVNLWTGDIAHKGIREQVTSVKPQVVSTDYVTGCCMVLPTRLAGRLKGFDPWYTMYGEDVDLSLRCKNSGHKLVFVPESKIYHKVSASIGGEFGLTKLKRKALGIVKIYLRHVSWYQWPGIVLFQAFRSFKYASIYFTARLKKTSSE